MGDRANIVIRPEYPDDLHSHEAVFLYTHWAGSEAPARLKAGLERAARAGRLEDDQYLSRILLEELVGDAHDQDTGFGISTRLADNGWPLLVVDVAHQLVIEYPEDVYRAVGFARLGSEEFVALAIRDYDGVWASER